VVAGLRAGLVLLEMALAFVVIVGARADGSHVPAVDSDGPRFAAGPRAHDDGHLTGVQYPGATELETFPVNC